MSIADLSPGNMTASQTDIHSDIVLVGGGVMSATLAILLKELQPDLTITLFESLEGVATESSNAWNNAGTGHAALCELNYTPQRPDGSVNVTKALEINESFEVSRQFWSHLVERGVIDSPSKFIHAVPHMSFVRGAENVYYLRKRFDALHGHHAFREMKYSEDPEQLAEWMPLVMDGREPEPVAATRVESGTDVNFGSLTRMLISHLARQDGVNVLLGHRVIDLDRKTDGVHWNLKVQTSSDVMHMTAGFVFLGAGGAALPLLQKSGIPEGHGFGGFPVSGQWLRCDDEAIVGRHYAKVYGRPSVGAPPMSVPHLDTRIVEGKQSLLFGPYAGFSTKFLKHGSLLDLPMSLKPDNLVPMLAAGRDNVELTKYLIGQVLQSPEDRFAALQEFVPHARMNDWRLETAGQRVQIIKKNAKRGGALQFGTEVVSSADGSIAALLGASPGASTSVAIMLHLIKRCFPERTATAAWQEKIKAMVPSHGESLAHSPDLFDRIRPWTTEVLRLGSPVPAAWMPHPGAWNF
jgi:malate dehydrogenase (quinone)